MAEIKPIETFYNGYRFRSRLEARWAVFFDALGVEYEYEPEGFVLPSGKHYLPDFRVKCYGKRGDCTDKPFDLWIEVKGKMTQEDADKIQEFAGEWKYVIEEQSWDSLENPVLIVGGIPNRSTYYYDAFHSYDSMDGINIYPWNYETIDGDYFAAYPAVRNGHFYLDGDDSNYTTMDPSIIDKAFDKARKARFEHGETPTI